VYDVLHDLPNPHKALGQIYKVLKKDGFFSLIEIGFHSNPVDNADDKGAALYYGVSTFICLQSSMSEEPHIGYGACWGKEKMEKALLDANFKINAKSSLINIDKKAFFFCTK
jgi:ubiquinone/menaquinone biosynthesis C-methylase UbiE